MEGHWAAVGFDKKNTLRASEGAFLVEFGVVATGKKEKNGEGLGETIQNFCLEFEPAAPSS